MSVAFAYVLDDVRYTLLTEACGVWRERSCEYRVGVVRVEPLHHHVRASSASAKLCNGVPVDDSREVREPPEDVRDRAVRALRRMVPKNEGRAT